MKKKRVLWKFVLGLFLVIGAGNQRPMDTVDVLAVLAGLALIGWGVAGLLRGRRGSPAPAPEPAPTTLPDDHTLHKEEYKVIGCSYHKDSFARLQTANPDYRMSRKKLVESGLADTRIFHYTYANKPVDLQLDTTDQFGKDRVMVLIAGQLVGYLTEEDDDHVLEVLQHASVKYITAKVTGGEYRIVCADGKKKKNSDPNDVRLRIGYSV